MLRRLMIVLLLVSWASIAQAEVDHKMTVDEFYAEFVKDRAGTVEKYNKKTLELSSTVSGIGVIGDHYLSLSLNYSPAEKEYHFAGLPCIFEEKNEFRVWPKIAKGQQITIRGKFEGYEPKEDANLMIGLGMGNCEIVDLGPSVVQPITVEQLAREFKKSESDFEEKYKGKAMFVKGVISSLGDDGDKLRGIEDVDLEFLLYDYEDEIFKEYQIGDTIHLYIERFSMSSGLNLAKIVTDTQLKEFEEYQKQKKPEPESTADEAVAADSEAEEAEDAPDAINVDPEQEEPKKVVRKKPTEREYRTWKSADGKFSVEARLVGRIGEKLILVRKDNDERIRVPLAKLSFTDRSYAETALKKR